MKFAFFEGFKYIYKSITNKSNYTSIDNLVFGGLAGCCAVSITYPTDLIRRRRQIQIIKSEKGNYLGIANDILKSEGIKGFYTGLKATYYKVIPSTALAFAINEFLKKKILIK